MASGAEKTTPKYPSVSSPGARPLPVWIRLEYNLICVGGETSTVDAACNSSPDPEKQCGEPGRVSMQEWINKVEEELVSIRRRQEYLGAAGPEEPKMLCHAFYEQGCNSHGCTRLQKMDGAPSGLLGQSHTRRSSADRNTVVNSLHPRCRRRAMARDMARTGHSAWRLRPHPRHVDTNQKPMTLPPRHHHLPCRRKLQP